MSMQNQKSRSEVSKATKNTNRKKDHEESIDQEMVSPDTKQRSNKHKSLQQSNEKKLKRKSGDHSSSAVKDSEMEKQDEEELPVDESMEDNEEDDDDDDDDDEDEDDYDDESIKDFIVEDEDVEEEEGDQENGEMQATEKGIPEKKRKKRKPKEWRPDEEDIDLIEENIGIQLKNKRKRLLKHSEREKDQADENEQETHTQQRSTLKTMKSEDSMKPIIKQQQLDDEDMADESEEGEFIDTRQNKTQKVMHKQKNYFDSEKLKEQFMDSKQTNQARQIFEDPTLLAEKIKAVQLQTKAQEKADKKREGLEEIFDGNEIDDQFATKQDKLIAERDIPERLQVKIGDRLIENFEGDFYQDLNNETQYVFDRLFSMTKRESLLNHEDKVKSKIYRVLSYFRKDYLDIPMIAKYRRYDYKPELEVEDIWTIFELDIEFGQFQQQLKQMKAFLEKIAAIDQKQSIHVEDISKVKNHQDLQNYQALIAFFKQYYFEQLQNQPDEQRKKVPIKTDHIVLLRRHNYDKFSKAVFLDPVLFVENLQNNQVIHKPPQSMQYIDNIFAQYQNDIYKDQAQIQSALCKFAASENAAMPYIRNLFKQHFMKTGTLTTTPTDQGLKTLDVFHPSYRVKRIKDQQLHLFQEGDVFLDVFQNEKNGLITVDIQIDHENLKSFWEFLRDCYSPQDYPETLKALYAELLTILLYQVLIPEIRKEIRDELFESAENFVIKKIKDTYRHQLMIGPFQPEEFKYETNDGGDRIQARQHQQRRKDDNIIPDRPRCAVMGVILQQIDQNNQVVTVAIVDKYGELQAHKDLQHLMEPRPFRQQQQAQTEEEDQKLKKARQAYNEERKEHESDKDKIKELIQKHNVDLIVVAANKLEAIQIKKVLSGIAEGLKNFADHEDQNKVGSKRRRGDMTPPEQDYRKEAFVIWGSLEIPKLYANTPKSQQQFKNQHLILRQAVCLARYEQDPMNEILNLWSFFPSENSVLQMNLHPFQKQINQAKLADQLEEVNVQVVNSIGIDLHLVIEHEHMHIQLSFLSGLGPRKAKQFIQKLRQENHEIINRSDLYKQGIISKLSTLSITAFLKIRPPHEHYNPSTRDLYDILDQTRIHQESYSLAHKIAKDLIFDGQEVDMISSSNGLKDIIRNPNKLKELNIDTYYEDLLQSNQTNMVQLLNYIIEELSSPFKDPREYRNPQKLHINNHQLFYMLIDESERTFKRGIIVTATVFKVQDNIVLCKLDNGLIGTVPKDQIEKTDKSLQDIISIGHVITGRIEELRDKDENKFGVTLNCRKQDLMTHQRYVDKEFLNQIPPEDLVNAAFQVEKSQVKSGKFVNRRINHPKFKNISSLRAVNDLKSATNGDYIFRPSSQGTDHITLTWKFYNNNIVHLNIEEREKPVGASIGSKLIIGDEVYDNLQEIVERYIIPCNRLVQEVLSYQHPNQNKKFIDCEALEDIEKILKEEKIAEPNKIPYKFGIMPFYPQHIVLAHIPKEKVLKEYIKVKPKGFVFHTKPFQSLQLLINWFKLNFKDKEYIKFMRRQKSPRAKITNNNDTFQQRTSAPEPLNQWQNVGDEWRRPNSVHSLNEETRQEHGGNARYGDLGGAGYSDYNQNQQMSDSRGAGRGGPRTCFNCGETGHMSRECPNPKKDQQRKPYGRGGGDRSDNRGRDDNRGRRNDDDYRNNNRSNNQGGGDWGQSTNDNQDNAWGAAQQNSPAYQSANAGNWGDTTNVAQTSNAEQWGNENAWGNSASQNDQNTSSAWGQKTPQRTDNIASSSGWGDNAGNNAWGNSTGNDNNDFGRSSPARSQRSYNDEGGRGRGRGRGDFQGERRGGHGGGGGPRACFRCNETGHMAKDCPNPDQRQGRQGGGGGDRACFKCNQTGHMARECPNQDARSERSGGDRGRGRGRGRGSGPSICYKCKQEGHFAKECPNESADNDGGRTYKRQRRDDGDSIRRDYNNDNDRGDNSGGGWNKSGGDDAWGNSGNNDWNNNAGGNDNNNEWGQSSSQQNQNESGNGWGNPDSKNAGGW